VRLHLRASARGNVRARAGCFVDAPDLATPLAHPPRHLRHAHTPLYPPQVPVVLLTDYELTTADYDSHMGQVGGGVRRFGGGGAGGRGGA
jgi:hypothetical protein